MSNDIDMVPDDPGEVLRPRGPDPAQIAAVIAEAEEAYNHALEVILEPIVTTLQEHEDLINRIDATCIGAVCSVTEAANEALAKPLAKIAKRVSDTIGNALSVLAQHGYNPPSMAEVEYAATTGDYLSQEVPPGQEIGPDGLTDAAREIVRQHAESLRLANEKLGTPNEQTDASTLPPINPLGLQSPVIPGIGGNPDAGTVVVGNPTTGGGYPPTGGGGPAPVTGGTTPPPVTAVLPVAGSGDGFGGVPACFVTQVLQHETAGSIERTYYCNGGCYYRAPRANEWASVLAHFMARFPDAVIGNLRRLEWRDEVAPGVNDFGNWALLPVATPTGVQTLQFLPLVNARYVSWEVGDGLFPYIAGYADFAFPLHPSCGGTAPPPPVAPPPVTPPPVTPPVTPPPAAAGCDGINPLVPRFDTAAECKATDIATDQIVAHFPTITVAQNWVPIAAPNLPGGLLTSAAIAAAVGLVQYAFAAAVAIPQAIWNRVRQFLKNLICGMGCRSDRLIAIIPVLFMAQFFNRLTGGCLGFFVRPWQQAVDRDCPFELPSVEQSHTALMAGTIDEPTWQCWVNAQGVREKPQKAILEAMRTRLNPHELTVLYMRKDIDEEQWRKGMRGLGVTKDEDLARYRTMVKAFPGVDDVIRFLVRDVADKKMVDRFSLEKHFEDKWQGQLIEYAEAQGVSRELAKYYWMAHWMLPSNTQLFTINHLFGPHRDDIEEKERLKETDIEDTMALNDMLPFWIPKLLASSFSHLTRVDARRAYRIGAIDEKQLRSAFLDVGYNVKNADILVDFTIKDYMLSAGKIAGLPTKKTYIDAFIRGEADEEETATQLLQLGEKPEVVNFILIKAKEAKRLRKRKELIAGVKKLFITGLFDLDEARLSLIQNGVSNDAATDLLGQWEVLRAGKLRMPSIAQLCKWSSNGWITREEHLKGLKQHKYSEEVAALLAADCQQTAAEKLQKQAAAYQKRQEQNAKQAAAAEQRRLDKLQKMWLKVFEQLMDEDLAIAKAADKIQKWYEANSPPPAIPA